MDAPAAAPRGYLLLNTSFWLATAMGCVDFGGYREFLPTAMTRDRAEGFRQCRCSAYKFMAILESSGLTIAIPSDR
jgi:hypothetical protein